MGAIYSPATMQPAGGDTMANIKKTKTDNVAEQQDQLQREIASMHEEALELREKNRRRWHRVGIFCGILLLLGIAVNVWYFNTSNLTQSLEEQMAAEMAEYQAQLESEYNQEQEEFLRMLGVTE